jgi:hypothetical protein
LCQSGRRNFQDQQEKVAMAHRLPKVHCKPGRRRPTSEPFQHLKTVKLQHFPTRMSKALLRLEIRPEFRCGDFSSCID